MNSVFFLTPAVQTNPSSLHLLQGNSPSHYNMSVIKSVLTNREVANRTFVFFIRHLSQAFHTLLCLPSAIEYVESGEIGECRCECAVEVLARFEVRCVGFVDLPELPFLVVVVVVCTLMCSSVGGLGRLCSIFTNVLRFYSIVRCETGKSTIVRPDRAWVEDESKV